MIPSKELNEMEISNMPEKDFKCLYTYRLEKRVEHLTETFNKETENLKRSRD